MATEEQIREALRSVRDPEIGKPIEDIGMLQRIEIDGGSFAFTSCSRSKAAPCGTGSRPT
jgi:Predicted metal-sulfur cluster biosynthetic enzyme